MPLNISKFTGPGSTPSRRRFWDSVVELVASEEKLPGDNVVVTEHQGYGSLIDVNPQRAKNQGGGGVGACCYDDGTCDDLTESDCTEAEGNWQGPGTTCDDDPSPCVGACCIDVDCFDDMTKADCETAGGTFQDFQSTCDDPDIDCTQGACCVDGVCSITTEGECTGHYRGGGTTCEDTTCPPMGGGACCHTDGSCTIETAETCDGTYQGDNVPCSDVDCTHTGACCDDSDCSIKTESDCSGKYLGDGSDCDPNPCPACLCGFLNPCDGKYYLTKTIEGSGDFTIDGPPENAWDFTSTAIFSCADGAVSCGGSGTGHLTIGGVFARMQTGSCGPLGDTNSFHALGGLPYWVDGESFNCTVCPKSDGWTLVIDTCTHQQYTKDTGVASGTVDANISYSDPCVPEGFSPPP